MKTVKNYDEAKVINSLKRKCNIDVVNKVITININNKLLGIRSWGKIDYLCNYCGYVYIKQKGAVIENTRKEDKEIDIVKNVKSIMKNVLRPKI